MTVRIHTGIEIDAMRRAGRLAGELICAVGEII